MRMARPSPAPTAPNPAAGITAISFDGTYSFTNLANDGTFSIALEAGIYEVSVWLDSATYPSIGGPEPFYVSVSDITPIGDIALVNRNVTISGNVTVRIHQPGRRRADQRVGRTGRAVLDHHRWRRPLHPDGHTRHMAGVADLLDNTSYIFNGDPGDQAARRWPIGHDQLFGRADVRHDHRRDH